MERAKLMKRSTTILIATAALFFLALLFIVSAKKQSQLTILINGVPAANLVVLEFQTATPRTLDATGTISYPSNTNTQHAVFVPQKNGSNALVSLPKRGHKFVDFRARMSVSKTVVYDYLYVRRVDSSEQFDLTDAEIDAIQTGKAKLEDIQDSIRKESN